MTEPVPPPNVPIRHTRWPTRRAPRWLIVAGLLVTVGAVLVALVVRPSRAQRASDLRGFISDMTTDIESCAGGVSESLAVLHAVQAGVRHDVPTALNIAEYGASNCSPANNELLDDLAQYQVTESLASFHLDQAVTGLLNWAAPDAINVQNDVARVLSARNATARQRAEAELQLAVARLNQQRAAIDSRIQAASTALAARAAPPSLPG